MKQVVFHDSANAELAEAMAWYEDRSDGLGDDLLIEVERAVGFLRKFPEMCPQHGETIFRKCFVTRFPYTIFFTELDEEIWIAAIAHQSRRPGYWSNRRT